MRQIGDLGDLGDKSKKVTKTAQIAQNPQALTIELIKGKLDTVRAKYAR